MKLDAETQQWDMQRRWGGASPDLEFREEFSAYLGTEDRQLRNELGEQSRWGDAATYGRTRKCRKRQALWQMKRNDSSRTFQ